MPIYNSHICGHGSSGSASVTQTATIYTTKGQQPGRRAGAEPVARPAHARVAGQPREPARRGCQVGREPVAALEDGGDLGRAGGDQGRVLGGEVDQQAGGGRRAVPLLQQQRVEDQLPRRLAPARRPRRDLSEALPVRRAAPRSQRRELGRGQACVNPRFNPRQDRSERPTVRRAVPARGVRRRCSPLQRRS